MVNTAAFSSELFPRSLIESDMRVLIGYGKHTATKQPKYLRVGECDVAVSGTNVSTHVVFELEHLTVPTMREIYVASLIKTTNRVRDIKTMEAFERDEIIARERTQVRKPRRAPEGDYRLRLLGRDRAINQTPSRSAPNGSTSEALMATLRPLSRPLVCSLRVFVLADGSPLLTLNDDALDRMVLAIGNVGDRIEWQPKAAAGYKPPWFEQTIGGYETTELV